jgi:uridylate kinase
VGAEVILKATKVDGVYDKDPMVHSDAVRYETLSYLEALQQQLKVMDSTAMAMCMDNDIPLVVFDLNTVGNVMRVVRGETVGTRVTMGPANMEV